MEPITCLDARTQGKMGVGLGYYIAAAIASPDRLVVAVEGDFGFGFSAMELPGHQSIPIPEMQGIDNWIILQDIQGIYTSILLQALRMNPLRFNLPFLEKL
ncbi:unnamed protein product [Lactuca saligna]|uniref:2-hydroxyacyl-CoA lyase n=1 Tax=Lactuca saligna TaxID=75948 RepID=A0AA35ZR39_LACSI|nr:unnamed protein product [Lactuca saligna]